MMISQEGYYEAYLKGKTKEQVMTAIRGLKQEIGRLKNMMESPDYGQVLIMHPSEDTRIHWTREYLEIAKQAYAEAGGTYTLSKSEEQSADFDLNMDAICKVTFKIGDFFGGNRSYVLELSDRLRACTKLLEDEEPLVLIDAENEALFTKATFIAALAYLHIGEWRRQYSTQRFGYTPYDGIHWELEFEYNNGHKTERFEGDNSYPYNFERLKIIFGINDTEEGEYE
jgi:hypothetical protein